MNCKHEWVRTASMAPGEARCIQCCQWAVTNARVSKPLTDEEINSLELPPSGTATIRDMVRIIERTHGIGGEE